MYTSHMRSLQYKLKLKMANEMQHRNISPKHTLSCAPQVSTNLHNKMQYKINVHFKTFISPPCYIAGLNQFSTAQFNSLES